MKKYCLSEEKVKKIRCLDESKENEEKCIPQNDYIKRIDKLINKMVENKVKSTCFKIIKFFKDNNYNEISYEDILIKLTNEYNSNPKSFMNHFDKPFTNLSKFIASVKISLKNNIFNSINHENTEYFKVNYPKLLDYLRHFSFRASNERKSINKEKKDSGIIFNINKIKKSPYNCSNYIGQKRSTPTRRNSKKKEGDDNQEDLDENYNINEIQNKKRKEINMKSRNKLGNEIIEESRESCNSTNLENKIKNERIFLEGIPLDKDLSNLSFGEEDSSNKYLSFIEINCNSFNPNSINKIKDNNKGILYESQEEEKHFNSLKNELKPIKERINQIKNVVHLIEQNFSSISDMFMKMNKIFIEYKNKKNKIINEWNILIANFEAIDNEIKIFNLCKNSENIPFQYDIFKMHYNYAKKLMEICRITIEENHKKIVELNNDDFNFCFFKLEIRNIMKEIIENKNNILSFVDIEYLIMPELITYFNQINYENKINEKNNEVNEIYNYFINIEKKYNLYVDKIESYANY